jgi:regulator of protease activity HflC (stomatin/prohibitin superfamily)
MRSEIGQLSLDHVLKERQNLNANITEAINDAAKDWVSLLIMSLTAGCQVLAI